MFIKSFLFFYDILVKENPNNMKIKNATILRQSLYALSLLEGALMARCKTITPTYPWPHARDHGYMGVHCSLAWLLCTWPGFEVTLLLCDFGDNPMWLRDILHLRAEWARMAGLIGNPQTKAGEANTHRGCPWPLVPERPV